MYLQGAIDDKRYDGRAAAAMAPVAAVKVPIVVFALTRQNTLHHGAAAGLSGWPGIAAAMLAGRPGDGAALLDVQGIATAPARARVERPWPHEA